VHPETIPAECMKGIGEDYRVYHVFDRAALRTQFALVENMKKAAWAQPQFVSDMERLREFMNDPSLNPRGIEDTGNGGDAD
jgi:hypothetical protein